MICLGRHTITGAICASGRQSEDWTSDYRLFSQYKWESEIIFDTILKEAVNNSNEHEPIVAGMDDSIFKKSSKKIKGAKYRRDPLSPPFRPNFVIGQRFLQISVMCPEGERPCGARAIPVDFILTPTVEKPKKNATKKEWKSYNKKCKELSLPNCGAGRLNKLRQKLDTSPDTKDKELIMVTDGSFTNSKVLKKLPEKTTLIGRIRGDANLHYLPQEQPKNGRKRGYGEPAPTPEELRKNDKNPYQTFKVFAAGKVHDFKVKTLSPVLWRKAGADKKLRLVVIAPLAYRLNKKSKILYRKPAHLICTDPDLPIDKLVQYYVWRWEVEVNFRDEKQIIGVNQAQVRSDVSVERTPKFSVGLYSMLLLAGIRSLKNGASDCPFPYPKWLQKKKKDKRLSTNDLISILRYELLSDPMESPLSNFYHFREGGVHVLKSKKLTPDIQSAVLYARA